MRMMLVGAGAVGESMLKILKWRDPKGEWLSYVLVGDYDLSRAEAVAGLLADDRFSAVQINATDKEQMKSLIREHKIDFVEWKNAFRLLRHLLLWLCLCCFFSHNILLSSK